MNLQELEIESIAGLKDSVGYKLVLDRVQAEADNVQAEMLDTEKVYLRDLTMYWRALHKILNILKILPEDMSKELSRLRDTEKFSEYNENVPKEYLDKLFAEYLKKKRLNKI